MEITYRWELTAGALTRPLFLLSWGILSPSGSFKTFFFYHRCRFGSSFIQLFVTWLFTKAFPCKKSIFSCHEFCFQLSTSCFPNPPPGWSAPSGPTKAVSSLHIMCQVHLMPLPSISRGFNQSYLQNWSLYREQQQQKELLTATATTLWFKDLKSAI